MTNSTQTLAEIDDIIEDALDVAGLVDTLTIAGAEIRGYFNRGYVTVGAGDDEHQAELISFDCRSDEWPPDVAAETEIQMAGAGTFRVLYSQANGIGRTLVVLGAVAASG